MWLEQVAVRLTVAQIEEDISEELQRSKASGLPENILLNSQLFKFKIYETFYVVKILRKNYP